jgi:hypothetical protein
MQVQVAEIGLSLRGLGYRLHGVERIKRSGGIHRQGDPAHSGERSQVSSVLHSFFLLLNSR